jgi:hypothetical protein
MIDEAQLQQLLDREAIRDCLMRYCQGVDRCDADSLAGTVWPDGDADFAGLFKGSGAELVAFIVRTIEPLEQTSHFLGNVIVRLDGDSARSESYFQAYHRVPVPGKPALDHIVGGRYLDRLEKRGNEWRIKHRVVVFDWYRRHAESADWGQYSSAGGKPMDPRALGGHKPDDKLYSVLDGLR